MEWKVYFGDGSTYSDEDGPIEEIPKRDCQVIAKKDEETGFYVLSGRDYYWYDEEWYHGDKFGLYDYLIRPGFKLVLFGRTLSNQEFSDILQRARDDPDLPNKSAYKRSERRPE